MLGGKLYRNGGRPRGSKSTTAIVPVYESEGAEMGDSQPGRTRRNAMSLRDAVDEALSNLECAELRCWSFTRAAMRWIPECDCANCETWRRLATALDADSRGAPGMEGE